MNNKNSEGYHDPTAYAGMKDIIRRETEQDVAIHKLIHHFKYIADLAGFDIANRIVFKHKNTGKVFK